MKEPTLMSLFDKKKAADKVLMINLALLLLATAALATVDYWFIYHGDYKNDPLISTRSFMMPFLILMVYVIIINTSYLLRKFMQTTKGLLLSLFCVTLPLVALSFFAALSIDKTCRSYALSTLANKDMFYCKMYSKGRGKSSLHLYYYATAEEICEDLIAEAPHNRKDFDNAIDIQSRLNSAEK